MVPDTSHCFQRKFKLPPAAHPASLNPSSTKEPCDRARIWHQRTKWWGDSDGEPWRLPRSELTHTHLSGEAVRHHDSNHSSSATSPSHQSRTGACLGAVSFLLAPFLSSKQWTTAYQAGKSFPSAKGWELQRDVAARVTCRAVVRGLKNQIIARVGVSAPLYCWASVYLCRLAGERLALDVLAANKSTGNTCRWGARAVMGERTPKQPQNLQPSYGSHISRADRGKEGRRREK